MQRIVTVDKVVLVTEEDDAVGVEDKRTAHEEGKLHRAFSILVLNDNGELLLQQRAYDKHHSGSLWSNTCCGHPRPGESLPEAARRRLREEMGFDCSLKEIFSFIYRAEVGNGSVEYEYDHVFLGRFDGEPKLNPEEAINWMWIGIKDLRALMDVNPHQFTVWLGLIIDKCQEPQRAGDMEKLGS